MALLVALYVLELSALAAALALHRYYNRLDILTLRQQIVILLPLLTLLASILYVARTYLRSRQSGLEHFGFTLIANLLGVVIALVAGEVVVRAFSVRTPWGESFAGTILLPRSWDDMRAKNALLLQHIPVEASYFVSDRVLGWAPGRSRTSADNMYFTSAEGLRSPEAGLVYAEKRTKHRIAIVGDSFTFGLEVPFEDSWGARLESALGGDVGVLNFGVDGYGVDQAYLRYERDIKPWHPEVTIFGFIEHDLFRSMGVYSFLTFPDWNSPYEKPRFVLKEGKLELINPRLESPAELVERKSITDLPLIEYESGYKAEEWEPYPFDSSRLLRFAVSRFPRWQRTLTSEGGEAIERVNAELLIRFTRQAAADGTLPMVVYLPSRSDFERSIVPLKEGVLAILRESGVGYLDLTSCMRASSVDETFLSGRHHYSPEGNAAVVRCLLPAVRAQLHRIEASKGLQSALQ